MKQKQKKENDNFKIVGREDQSAKIQTCLRLAKNVMIEGPVGVGKTFLALHCVSKMGLELFRIDGDQRYTEQKLAGGFDPSLSLKYGMVAKSFMPGPLTLAMQKGAVLFINELNRLPEGVQNILLPALDEGVISIPKLGMIRAKPGFCVIATQNPKEFVATTHLSEAILDRFEWIKLGYPPFDQELELTKNAMQKFAKHKNVSLPAFEMVCHWCVDLVRYTREAEELLRGGSIRATLSMAELCLEWVSQKKDPAEAFLEAALLALPTRIEIDQGAQNKLDVDQWIKELVEQIQKKKSLLKTR